MGRPTKYKPEYCQEIIDFFNIEPYREVMETYYYKNGESKETVKLVANDLPFISMFAHKIDVSTTAIKRWNEKYPEFSTALKKAKELQQNHLVQNGLQGNYQTAFAIFTAKNITDWRDNNVLIDQSKHNHFVIFRNPKALEEDENRTKPRAELKDTKLSTG